MKREIISPKFGPVRGVSPIVRGGHDANNAPEAVMNLGLMPVNSLGMPDGPAKLDSAKLLVENQLPSQLSKANRVNGPSLVQLNTATPFYITNYDCDTTYSVIGGTSVWATLKKNGIIEVKPIAEGIRNFSLDGVDYWFEVKNLSPYDPTVIFPTNNALKIPVDVTFNSSAYATRVPSDLHDSTEWQLATDPGFSNVIKSSLGPVNLISWSVTGLVEYTDYYVRVKHKAQQYGWTDWSPVVKFKTRTLVPSDVESKLIASNTNGGDYFGQAVAISGDGNTVVVGSDRYWYEGAAYIYVRNGTTWSEQAILVPSTPAAYSHFASCVAISDDGNTVVVGQKDADGGKGSAYVFSRSGTTWSESKKLKPLDSLEHVANGKFGQSVTISGDGSLVAVGSQHLSFRGAVFTFARASGWEQQAVVKNTVPTDNEYFSESISLSAAGTVMAVSNHNTNNARGSVVLFINNGSGWVKDSEIVCPTSPTGYVHFGQAVSISGDGNRCLIGAPFETIVKNGTDIGRAGAAYFYHKVSGVWTQVARFARPMFDAYDDFGSAVAICASGNIAVVGGYGVQEIVGQPNTGTAVTYQYVNNAWEFKGYLIPPDFAQGDKIGYAVDITNAGDRCVVGSPNDTNEQNGTGSAYIFA